MGRPLATHEVMFLPLLRSQCKVYPEDHQSPPSKSLHIHPPPLACCLRQEAPKNFYWFLPGTPEALLGNTSGLPHFQKPHKLGGGEVRKDQVTGISPPPEIRGTADLPYSLGFRFLPLVTFTLRRVELMYLHVVKKLSCPRGASKEDVR